MTDRNGNRRYKNNYSEPPIQNNEAVWKEHASIRQEIGALKQAGEDRDKRIEEIKQSVDNLSKSVNDIKIQLNSLLLTIKVISGVATFVIAAIGVYLKFFK